MTSTAGRGPDQIPDGWNATAAKYDDNVWDLMTPFVQEAIRLAELGSDQELLDVAAGSGRVSVEAAPFVKRVLATDFATEMLGVLRARAKRGGHGNIEIAQMDGQNLEVADGSFDRVMSNFGVIFFPDQAKGLFEMHRVLRPGGRAVVTAWSRDFDMFRLFGLGMREALPDLPPPADPAIFSLADPAAFEALIGGAGFADAKVHTVTHDFGVDSAEVFWELMSGSAPPAVALLRALSDEQVASVRKAVVGKVVAEKGSGKVMLSSTAHIGVGIK